MRARLKEDMELLVGSGTIRNKEKRTVFFNSSISIKLDKGTIFDVEEYVNNSYHVIIKFSKGVTYLFTVTKDLFTEISGKE